MMLQFKCVSDDSLWLLDTDKLRYARTARPISEILDAPSADPVIEEFGELKSMDKIMELYQLVGRTRETEAPGQGLCSVAILARIYSTGTIAGVSANVQIKDCICLKPYGITCEIIGQRA